MRLRPGNSGGWLMAVGVLLAAAAAGIVWMLGRTAHRTVRVLVATQAVPPLTLLEASDLAVRPRPAASVPRDALRDERQAAGRFVRYGLLPGQTVRAANLETAANAANRFDEQLTVAAKGSSGLRAVTLSVTPQAGLALPVGGDRVDLLAVVSTGNAGSKQARLLVQGALVLDRLVTGAAGGGGSKQGRPAAAQVRQGLLVLALTVPQAQQVALAQASGTVRVLLDPLGRAAPVRARPLTAAAWGRPGVPARPAVTGRR